MRILTFLTVVLFSFSASAEKAAFVAGFEDLPMMPGMIQAGGDSVSFDTPSGRFVEVYVETAKADKAAVESFYDRTLPQLGWKKKNSAAKGFAFTREGEELFFTVDGKTVRVELKTP